MTLVPPADAAIGADAPVPGPPEPLDDLPSDDQPLISSVVTPTPPSIPDVGGTITAFIRAPWTTDIFVSGVSGWGPITKAGVVGPASSIAAVTAAGVSVGITIESR